MRVLHLLDGTYELFRAYHALPSLQAPDGRPIGAVYGMVSSLLTFLREVEITHIAAATDHTVESFRNQLFAGYKCGAGIPEDLLAQFPLAEEALRALGFTVWPMTAYEADDALASAATRFEPHFERIVIVSPDKDFLQCVTDDRLVTYDRFRKKTFDRDEVIAKMGVPPASVPDFLALVGDPADGIPGLPGWGPRSAAAVLSAYRTIDAVPDEGAAWEIELRGRERLARTLATHRTEAKLFRQLATLRRDVPIAESYRDLAWRGVPRRLYRDFCRRNGMGRLENRPIRWC